MRRLTLLFFMFLFVGSSFAVDPVEYEEIPLQVSFDDPTLGSGPIRRAPIRVPSIGINGNTLYFFTPCDGCTLFLYDEDGEIAYSIIIPENSSTINLPYFLVGEYEIEIVRGRFSFHGFICL